MLQKTAEFRRLPLAWPPCPGDGITALGLTSIAVPEDPFLPQSDITLTIRQPWFVHHGKVCRPGPYRRKPGVAPRKEGGLFRGGIRMTGSGQRIGFSHSIDDRQPSTLTGGTRHGTVVERRSANASRSGTGKLQEFDFSCAWVWRIEPRRCVPPIPSAWRSMSAEGTRG